MKRRYSEDIEKQIIEMQASQKQIESCYRRAGQSVAFEINEIMEKIKAGECSAEHAIRLAELEKSLEILNDKEREAGNCVIGIEQAAWKGEEALSCYYGIFDRTIRCLRDVGYFEDTKKIIEILANHGFESMLTLDGSVKVKCDYFEYQRIITEILKGQTWQRPESWQGGER